MIKCECDVVKDLFASYDDGKVRKETKNFIDEHLKECEKCKEEFEKLKMDMLEKKKCEIVKDLLTNYEDGIVSSSTKEFIEEHLNKCSKCKEDLEIIKAEKAKEEKEEKDKEKPVMNHLQKLNKRLSMAKNSYLVFVVIIFVLICLLVVAWS